jgi:hypothetical protein
MKKRKIIFTQSQWELLTAHLAVESDLEQAALPMPIGVKVQTA